MHRVYESEGVSVWNGRNRLFLRQLTPVGTLPDAYLFRISAADTGWIDRGGAWKCDAAALVSFSEGNGSKRSCWFCPIRMGAWRARNILRGPTAGSATDRGCVARSEVRSVCVTPRERLHSVQLRICRWLRQVMYSKYVTQTQLWQFMRHNGYELSKGSFWWRVKRLRGPRLPGRGTCFRWCIADPIFRDSFVPALFTSLRISVTPIAVRKRDRKSARMV